MTQDGQQYLIRNRASGLLLELSQPPAADGKRLRQGRQWAPEAAPTQLWRVTPVFEGSSLHHLVSVSSGERLDAAAAAPGAEGVPRGWANDHESQEWLLEEHLSKPGTYSLVSYASGLLLEVADGSLEEGAVVRQGEDIDSPCQWWTLEGAHD